MGPAEKRTEVIAARARGLSLLLTLTLAMVGLGPGTALAASGDRLWLARYNGPGNGDDKASSTVVSPDGATVFVTGESLGSTTNLDYATLAYDAATRQKVWTARYNGPGNGDDEARSLAVSPDGTTVFVTGLSLGLTSREDYATVAYDAATGQKVWTARYNGPGNDSDIAKSVAVSPDSTLVFVTGLTVGSNLSSDYATLAYDAATGQKLWSARYDGTASGDDEANSVVVSPDGATVFVTGLSHGATFGPDYATVAYEAASGHRLWSARYDGPDNYIDVAVSAAVSPDGARVFVTGQSTGSIGGYDYATLAYDTSTGHRLWVVRYNGVANGDDLARSVAVSQDGAEVFVTGSSTGSIAGYDYATVAYDAVAGQKLWVARYRNGEASSVVASPDGAKVFVTGGSSGDYATVVYDAVAGQKLWAARYNGRGNGTDFANSLAVNPDGTAVIVTGRSIGLSGLYDYATVAYET